MLLPKFSFFRFFIEACGSCGLMLCLAPDSSGLGPRLWSSREISSAFLFLGFEVEALAEALAMTGSLGSGLARLVGAVNPDFLGRPRWVTVRDSGIFCTRLSCSPPLAKIHFCFVVLHESHPSKLLPMHLESGLVLRQCLQASRCNTFEI